MDVPKRNPYFGFVDPPVRQPHEIIGYPIIPRYSLCSVEGSRLLYNINNICLHLICRQSHNMIICSCMHIVSIT